MKVFPENRSWPEWCTNAEWRAGVNDMMEMTPAVVAWGIVTGVGMVKAGLPFHIAILMSLTVFAASAQLAALPLMLAGAPIWVVMLTALCVNLRFVIFSASMRIYMMGLPLKWRLLAGYLTADVTYVLMMRRHGHPREGDGDSSNPLSYFTGLCCVNWLSWNLASLIGVCLSIWIPDHWGLGFAGCLALIGLLVSLVNDRRSGLSASVAGLAAICAFALPYKLHMVVSVCAAVACGLMIDAMLKAEASNYQGRA